MAKTKVKNRKSTKESASKDQNVEENSSFEALAQSEEALQESFSKSQEFANKNKNIISIVLSVVVLIIGGIFFYQLMVDRQDGEAQEQLFPAIFYFEKDSLGLAMQGDGNYTEGFEAIKEEFGLAPAGNLSNFYAGAIALKQGDFDTAIEYLNSFSSSDYLVQARAYCLVGDAYMEKEDYSNAASFYKKAVDYYPNEQFTPQYMLKLALAYEMQSNNQSAASVYQDIIDNYGKATTEVTSAKKYLANLK